MTEPEQAEHDTDPLRAYIKTLRKGRHISQEHLADQVGMGRRTYVAWERGETKTLKSHYAQAMIRTLSGAPEHLDQLDRLSADAARDLAAAWLAAPTAAPSIPSRSRRVIELADNEPPQLEEVIAELRRQAQSDPAILSWIAGFLARGASGR